MPTSFDVACVKICNVSKVKLEECGRKVLFANPANTTHTVVQIDGCVVKSGPRADWVVSRSGIGSVVVELKGKDVAHALEQVEATLSHCRDRDYLEPKVAALIICRQVPKALTSIQRAKDRFRKRYGASLTVSSSRFEFEVAALIA